MTDLVRLDRKIDQADKAASDAFAESLRLRWEFGHTLLAEREGKKRLPNGRLRELAQQTGKSQSELKRRMQFAEQYDSEQLAHVWASFTSWRDVAASLSDTVPQDDSEPVEKSRKQQGSKPKPQSDNVIDFQARAKPRSDFWCDTRDGSHTSYKMLSKMLTAEVTGNPTLEHVIKVRKLLERTINKLEKLESEIRENVRMENAE